ncbi:hypothetical protein HanPI659440_Chr04g0159811 [Helianthus annuus]|nr:hypothetical protein HanPI659440_Chr04g0159811 [Helianthus annuus]
MGGAVLRFEKVQEEERTQGRDERERLEREEQRGCRFRRRCFCFWVPTDFPSSVRVSEFFFGLGSGSGDFGSGSDKMVMLFGWFSRWSSSGSTGSDFQFRVRVQVVCRVRVNPVNTGATRVSKFGLVRVDSVSGSWSTQLVRVSRFGSSGLVRWFGSVDSVNIRVNSGQQRAQRVKAWRVWLTQFGSESNQSTQQVDWSILVNSGQRTVNESQLVKLQSTAVNFRVKSGQLRTRNVVIAR